jgi:hypothetical protein
MKRHLFFCIAIYAMLVFLTGCSLFETAPIPTLDENLIQTYAAQTVQARQTLSALESMVAVLTNQPPTNTTQPSADLSATPRPPTSTTNPTNTMVSLPTSTPTVTPVPQTPTPETPCLWAAFVKDVSIPDGTSVVPGNKFTKTWRLQNKGTCTWTSGYHLVFVSGDAMGGPASVPFAGEVLPGKTVDLSIDLIAPSSTGGYTGNYMLETNTGTRFGTGFGGGTKFFVKITVATATLTDLHIVNQYCNATWKSSTGPVACPSSSYDFTNGSVVVNTAPKLEGGYTDNEPAIVMVPSNGTGGEISGRFPAFTVKTGNHFLALTGLMDGYTNGNVMFMVNYSVNGGADQNLKTWTKTYDKSFVRIDIDLSSLAGQSVQLVLKVLNNNSTSTDDVAFWLNPYISGP